MVSCCILSFRYIHSNKKDCLRSLAFDGSRDREGVVDNPTDSTCEWLLKSPEYLRWVHGHGLLLIRGQPGCGKSTLLKFALGKQLEAAASVGSVVLAFFFYSSGTELQNGIVGLFRSFLLQLFEQDVSSRSTFHEICRKRWTAGGKKNRNLIWHQNELQANFKRLVLECSAQCKTTIFIDAIDECRAQDRDCLVSFFHSLKGKAQIRLDRPKICFTCRLYPDGQIDADFWIRLEEENQHDIQIFIEQELRLPDETEPAINEFKQILQEKANGLFLWLVLIIRQVRDMSSEGLNLKIIQKEIWKCPRKLDGLYEGLLEKIEDKDLRQAGKLFQWICFAGRPLSLDELRTAMTVHLCGTKSSLDEYENDDNYITNKNQMKTRIMHLSRGLADVANSNSAEGKILVGFYHATIKDFMLTKGLQYLNCRLKQSRGLIESAHFQLANTCIDYISTKEICTAFSKKWMTFPTQFCFLDYAATSWLAHAIKAEKDGTEEHITWPSQSVLNMWVNLCRISDKNSTQCPKEGTTLMHIAAEYGLERLAKSIWIRSTQNRRKSTQPKSTLCDTLNAKTQRQPKNTPKENTTNVMPSTIKKNQHRSQKESSAKRRSHSLAKDPTGGSTQRATRTNQRLVKETEKMSKAGLDAGAIRHRNSMTNATNKAGESPIYVAARCGHIGMVRFLLEHDSEVNAGDQNGRTPLYTASMNGHLDVVKFLYEHGADADIHTATKDG
jgi:hypothetical protein